MHAVTIHIEAMNGVGLIEAFFLSANKTFSFPVQGSIDISKRQLGTRLTANGDSRRRCVGILHSLFLHGSSYPSRCSLPWLNEATTIASAVVVVVGCLYIRTIRRILMARVSCIGMAFAMNSRVTASASRDRWAIRRIRCTCTCAYIRQTEIDNKKFASRGGSTYVSNRTSS